jgi:Ser/Thr protein kinase RdoA (MazF antagonist)
MNNNILKFDSQFPELLKSEAEKILNDQLELGDKFESSDSFSYLLTSNKQKYVGKIYRFKDWPSKEKLKLVEKLLDEHGIKHEEIIFSTHQHSTFRFGWQLSKYISGGTASNLLKNEVIGNKEYYFGLGKLLRRIHEIKLNYYGSLDNEKYRFKSFKEYMTYELEEQDFTLLPEEYSWAIKIIEEAKQIVLQGFGNLELSHTTLVHDDANERNVIWSDGKPLLIDWIDSLAAPSVRDFATMTFRKDESVLHFIEDGYGKTIDKEELRLHQAMRFVRLGHFFLFEDKDLSEFEKMIVRLKELLTRKFPYGI